MVAVGHHPHYAVTGAGGEQQLGDVRRQADNAARRLGQFDRETGVVDDAHLSVHGRAKQQGPPHHLRHVPPAPSRSPARRFGRFKPSGTDRAIRAALRNSALPEPERPAPRPDRSSCRQSPAKRIAHMHDVH